MSTVEHKDFLGYPLSTGDGVVLIEPHYRNFIVGTVTGFTPKFVYVEYTTRNYSTKIKQTGCQLIRL